MANKKFKTGVDLQSTVKISSETANKALILDGSGNLVSSTVSDTELGYISGLTSSAQTQLTSAQGDATQALSDASDAQTTANAAIPATEKGANSGVATLDAGGKLSSGQIPAIAITSTFVVATEIAQLALTVQEGDVAVRSDLNQSYIALNADNVDMGDWQLLLTPTDAVQSVNTQTGVVVLDADDISDSATTNKYVTAADITKLGNLSGTNSGDEVAASDTVSGIVELATIAEVDTGTDTARAITPAGLAGSQLQTDVTANNSKVSADGSVATHSDVTSAGSGIIISGAERTKLNGIEALATADQTGAEIKSAYEAEVDTNAYDDAAVTKLGGIEALADVTDAINVDAAGAVMESDTTTASMSFVIDEDNMTSDLDTKVPTQQSVKAYVTSQVSGIGAAGDISETSFSGAADTATNLDVTGLAFANGTVRSFDAQVSVQIDATADLFENFRLLGIQKGASWDMSIESVGDDSLVSFSITTAGQVQYSKSTTAGWVSSTLKFRALTTSV